MSVLNATILRVDAQGTPDAGGDVSFVNGAAIAIRATMYGVRSSDRVTLGAIIKDASASLLVRKSVIPAGLAIETDYRLVASQDTEPQKTYRVVFKRAWIKGSLSSWELFLQELS
jgi:hypothetical protein